MHTVKYTCTNSNCGIVVTEPKKIDKKRVFCIGLLLCLFWGFGLIVMFISLFVPTVYFCTKCNSKCKIDKIKNNA